MPWARPALCGGAASHGTTIAFIGLDGAGKSTVLACLTQEPVDDVSTTIGFCNEELKLKGELVDVFDLGGGPKIRDIWGRYFAEVHGLVYVVDVANMERISEAQSVLESTASHRFVAGKPILVLGNKIDNGESLNTEQTFNILGISELGKGDGACEFNVQVCSAKYGRSKPDKGKPDAGIKAGMKWLVKTMVHRRAELRERVKADLTEQQAIEAEEMRLKREQIQARREAEESADKAKAAAEAASPGGVHPPGVIADNTVVEDIAPVDDSGLIRVQPPKQSPHQQPRRRQQLQGPADRSPARSPGATRSLDPDKLLGNLHTADNLDALSVTSDPEARPPLDAACDPGLEALALKLVASLNEVQDAGLSAEKASFDWKTALGSAREAWAELKKQYASKAKFNVQRIASKANRGWCAVARMTWDEARYGKPTDDDLEVDPATGLWTPGNFVSDKGLALYLQRVDRIQNRFEDIPRPDRGQCFLIAEILADQFSRSYSSARHIRLRKRDRKVAVLLTDTGLISNQRNVVQASAAQESTA